MHLESVSAMQPTPQSSPFYGQEGDFAVVEMSENLKYFSRQPSPEMDVSSIYNSLDNGYLDAMTVSKNAADDGFSELYFEDTNSNNIMNASVDLNTPGAPAAGFHSMPLTPPSINVEVAEESSRKSSLMTASNAIVEALGGLNEVFNLIEDEWSNSLDSILSEIPSTTPLPELVVNNQKAGEVLINEAQSTQCEMESSIPQNRLLSLPGNTTTDASTSVVPSATDCTVQCSNSPMSISPDGSSVPSPLTSLRSSFNYGRRFKRSHSSSPQSSSGLDVNTIIRLSPNCLMATPPNGHHENNVFSPLNGSYGHFIPRPEANNNHAQKSNLNFASLLSDSNTIATQSQITSTIAPSQTESSFFRLDASCKDSSSNRTNVPFSYQQSMPFSLHSNTTKPSYVSVFFNDSNDQGCDSVFPSISQSPRPLDSAQSTFSSTRACSPSMEQGSEDSHVADDEGQEDLPRVCKWVDCNAVFSDRSSLSRHIERAHVDQRKGDDYTCFWSACQRKYRAFNARYKLLIHMRVHSGEKPNKCTFSGCDKAFSRLENLKIHLRSHTGERPYVCVHHHCNKSFSNSSDRAKHQRTHLDAKPYVCYVPGCLKRYTDPSSLRKHVKNHSARDQLLAKRKSRSSDTYSSSRSPILAPLPPLLQEGQALRTSCDTPSRSDPPTADIADGRSPAGGCVGGDVVRFSLRCHVLSRRPRDIHETTGLPELELASQEDLDLWIS